jgi:hypothetical protein
MKKLLAAATLALSITSHVYAQEPPLNLRISTKPPAVVYAAEPEFTIVSRDAASGTIKVRLAADLCGPTDTEVEAAMQALFDALSQVPEVYERAEVENEECQVNGVYTYSELVTLLQEMGE